DEILRSLEHGRAGAQEYAQRVAVLAGHGEVELAVAVHIRHGYGARVGCGGEVLFGGEGPIAVPHEHAHREAMEVRHGEVGLAVAIDVRYRGGDRTGARGRVLLAGEGAIAVAQ